MAKAVVFKTDNKIKIIGTTQCSNGLWFDAEGCFQYCQAESEGMSEHQALKLCMAASTLGWMKEKQGADWYKHRENFIDIEVPFDCIQTFNWDEVDSIIG